MRRLALALVIVVLLAACGRDEEEVGGGGGDIRTIPTLKLESPAWENDGTIPERYTCEGENRTPPLRWSGVPDDAVELALVVVDRNAPSGEFFHWTMWGIDPELTRLDEGRLPRGVEQGAASSGTVGWIGPCPPADDEPHRYEFTLTAVSAPLELDPGAAPEEVESAIAEFAIVGGTLAGRYGR